MKSEHEHTELNEKMWDKRAETFDEKSWRTNYLRKAQSALIDLLDIENNTSFLEVGCGTGWALGQIAILRKGKGRFYGVDLSSKMIDKAKENFKTNPNFLFIKANAESIPLDDDSFDVIICTNSFHHYLRPAKAFREMRRLLRSSGKLYILDPTADTWYVKLADKLMKLTQHEHVKLYSTEEFQKLFADSGLKYVQTKMIKMHQKVHIGEK